MSAIAAIDKNYAIGKGNNLPWRLPEDLKFFKRMTLGKPVLMGRKTFESLGNKPLPGRLNIVLSGQTDLALPEHVLLYSDINAAIRRLQDEKTEEAFIIGGGKIFTETLPILDRLYLTHIDTEVEGADAFFPHIDHSNWKTVWEEHHGQDDKHAFNYTFRKYERINL
ncbi:MAG: dihydrofolate reductase [Sphingobacteriales bacterium]|nr:MAG: dihydrofolate reductase [Sphingobacteriales bacterium]